MENANAVTTGSVSLLIKLTLVGFFIFLAKLSLATRKRNPKNLPYPPGPKSLPFIGSLLEMPSMVDWVFYDKWKKKYGDMVYFEVMGQAFLVLGSWRRVQDLMERRSAKYSDRLEGTMMSELMGWSFSFALQPYGPWWRRHRRMFHQHFNTGAIHKYESIQADETRLFVQRLLDSDKNLFPDIRRLFAGSIMRIVYGIPICSYDDEHITRAETTLAGFTEAAQPGMFMVDFIPALKYVPAWFPGGTFQRKAARWKAVLQEFCTIPFRIAKDRLMDDDAPPSVAASLIKSISDHDTRTYAEEEQIARNVCAIAYAGGADTTLSSVQAFFLAMALHPEIVEKAHEELDHVVGPHRLPDFTDEPSLPYIKAICKEVLRWHLVIPLGIPHRAIEDDEYDGYFIPKGTLVMGNSWSILHDEDVFDNPEQFNPDRYMKDGKFNTDILDPLPNGAFGFGRRICPGRHLAEKSLYSIVSACLAVFNIKRPVDNNGKPCELSYKPSEGVLSYPEAFLVDIKPRSPQAERLARQWSINDQSNQ